MPAPDNPEREIFAAALDCPTPAARAAYLDAACGADSTLRSRVEALLHAHAAAGRFLDDDTANAAELDHAAASQEVPGTRIGRYRLVEKIGEGGFGVVYRAEQETPVRRIVALKIIKLGMDTRSVVARFEAERQALALLDHPGIAKVLDGGASETGRPYFVMELVPGVSITKFCAEHRLTTRERLELFMRVCDAVQHAHQKGIIHRDLKPSNILVAAGDRGPEPKVIDFGIAKATQHRLTDQTALSRLHPFIGTPAYMSPEQADSDGIDVDTRSDLYSLGVLLYELLTDRTPFETQTLLRAGYAEIQRILREEEPLAPSRRVASLAHREQTIAAQRQRLEPARLTRQLRGDLDRIVMKCLEKNRARRYDTSSALAADLARHLNDEPVLARPDTWSYRGAKFLRRHTRAVVTTLAAAAALAGFVVYHTAQLTAERDRARHEADKATSLSQLLTELWTASDPYRSPDGAEPTVRAVLDAGAQRVRAELAGQPELQASMLTLIGRVYRRLGLPDQARPLLEDAVRLSRPLTRQPLLLAGALNDLGVVLAEKGDYAAAESLLTEALTLRRAAPGAEAEVAVTLVELSRVHLDLASPDRAEPLLRESLAIRRRVLGATHRETATSLGDLGLLLWETGDLAGAEANLRECWEIDRKVLGDDHPNTGTALANVALIVLHRGDQPAAERMFREALAIRRRALGEAHPDLAVTLNNLGHALREQARFAEATAAATEALELTRATLGESHPRIAAYTAHLAQIHLERGDAAQAEPLARAALDLRQRVTPDDAWRIAAAKSLLGAILTALGRYDEAGPLLLAADPVLRDVPGPQGREAAAHRARLAAFRAAHLPADETAPHPSAQFSSDTLHAAEPAAAPNKSRKN